MNGILQIRKEKDIMNEFIEIYKKNVAMYPDKVAVVDETCKLTYAQLDIESDKIAKSLNDFGDDKIVAVCMDRSADFVSTIIAIFKLGRVYLPIDPEYPSARIKQMLVDADVGISVTTEEYCEKVKNCSSKMKVLELESVDMINTTTHDFDVLSQEDAYIIFTSGTTGKPKGAIVKHEGMMNHLQSKIELLGLSSDTKIIEIASQCFDISVWQFLSALLVGGEVHIITKEHVRDITFMIKYINDNNINILEMVPTLFSEIITMISNDKEGMLKFNTLQYILLTGEVLPVSLCCKWYALNEPAILVNAYGPTECSDDVTHYVVPRNIAITEKKVPIGKVIRNTELYIIKSRMENGEVEVAEQGEKGELYICGTCLGNGYVNNAKKTVESFVYIMIDGERKKAYKTGDIVSLNDEENYVFWERVDRQIKLNGYRIEVEEIEEVIRSYENVNNCCVVKRTVNNSFVYYLHNEDNNRKMKEQEILVAYIVCRNVDVMELKQWLEGRLPFFMVPEQYICIEEMPVTSNGKINYAKLPEPSMKRNIVSTTYENLQTNDEKAMAKIWTEILNISPIGRKDSFLELGGDSLTAIQVITRIKDKFKVSLSYTDFLRAKTLEEVCILIEAKKQENKEEKDIEFDVSEKNNYFEATYGQKGQWFLWKLSKESPFYTFQGLLNIFGESDYEKINRTINYLVCNNAVLRTRFIEKDREVKQYVEEFVYSNYRCVDLTDLELEVAESKMREIAYKIASTPFDLEKEVMIKFIIFYMPNNQYVIVVTMHEIIMDAWATRQLIQEFVEAYKKVDKLEFVCEKKYQFHDFAEWQRKNITRKTLSKEHEYWMSNLAGELPILDIAMDYPRPQIPTYRGKSQGLTFNDETSRKIKQFCVKQNVTLFTVLLAGYYMLLSKYSNQEEIIIGTPYACRKTRQREELYGYCLNMLPLRLRSMGNDTLQDIVQKVQETLNNGIDNSDYPFIWTVEDLKIERDTSYSPVFQVMFDMLNFPKVNFPIDSNISLNFEEIDIGYKKYDLEMYGNEQDGKIYVRISYLTDLFSDYTINQFLESYEKIICQIVFESNKLIKDIDILSVSCMNALKHLERSNVLPKYQENNLLSWLRNEMKGKENRVAYKTIDEYITFGELDKKIDSVSMKIKQLSIEEGSRVLLYGEKSLNYLYYMFALYQNRVTYVPCDTQRSVDSIYEISNELEIEYIISSIEIVNLNFTKVEEYCSFGIYKNVNKIEKKQIAACIIRTSGSSGKEKYVEINRESFCNRIFSQIEDYPLQEHDVIGSFRSCSLVTHIFEIYIGLITKNTTIMLNRFEVLNEDCLIDAIEKEKISYLTLSPSLLRLILSAKKRRNVLLDSIRNIFSGSDKLDETLVYEFYENFNNAILYNTYGSTETSSTILVQKIGKDNSVEEEKPIKGTKIQILDKYGKVQPFGVEGEVAVSGILLSNGYVLKNSKRSIVEEDSDEKYYLTGDYAYLAFDGSFHLIGRKDRTIKSRGYRINMAEIEAQARKCKGVELVACLFYEKNDTLEYSLLYTTKENNLEDEIRNYLLNKYPVYMMPNSIIKVEQIPQTINGKIKYSDLHNMLCYNSSMSLVDIKEELTETEKIVKQIFCEVLEIEDVPKDKSFFLLGGHSLSAVVLCAEISDILDFDLDITDLYGGIVSVSDIASFINSKK